MRKNEPEITASLEQQTMYEALIEQGREEGRQQQQQQQQQLLQMQILVNELRQC